MKLMLKASDLASNPLEVDLVDDCGYEGGVNVKYWTRNMFQEHPVMRCQMESVLTNIVVMSWKRILRINTDCLESLQHSPSHHLTPELMR